MLKDTTVTITRSYLDARGACGNGLAAVRDLLPAKLSTDPDRNFDLAFEIASRSAGSHVAWLGNELCWGIVPWPDTANKFKRAQTWSYCGTWHEESEDPTIIAQHLAAIADYIATREGR